MNEQTPKAHFYYTFPARTTRLLRIHQPGNTGGSPGVYLLSPDPERIKELVEEIGEDWYPRYVKPEFTTICRKVISRYNSESVTQLREQLAQEILRGQAAAGESLETRGLQAVVEGTPILIHSVVVGNIDFPDVVDQEIERKLAKQQELEKQATQLEIAKKEAQIKVEEAKGIAESQKIINKTLTPAYLQHEAIITTEKLAKEGKMNFYFVPTSPSGMGMPLVLNNSPVKPSTTK